LDTTGVSEQLLSSLDQYLVLSRFLKHSLGLLSAIYYYPVWTFDIPYFNIGKINQLINIGKWLLYTGKEWLLIDILYLGNHGIRGNSFTLGVGGQHRVFNKFDSGNMAFKTPGYNGFPEKNFGDPVQIHLCLVVTHKMVGPFHKGGTPFENSICGHIFSRL